MKDLEWEPGRVRYKNCVYVRRIREFPSQTSGIFRMICDGLEKEFEIFWKLRLLKFKLLQLSGYWKFLGKFLSRSSPISKIRLVPISFIPWSYFKSQSLHYLTLTSVYLPVFNFHTLSILSRSRIVSFPFILSFFFL